MMIDPPIDKLIEKTGCKYALVCLITKRARFLLDKRADYLLDSAERPIALAARELYEDIIRIGTEE